MSRAEYSGSNEASRLLMLNKLFTFLSPVTYLHIPHAANRSLAGQGKCCSIEIMFTLAAETCLALFLISELFITRAK